MWPDKPLRLQVNAFWNYVVFFTELRRVSELMISFAMNRKPCKDVVICVYGFLMKKTTEYIWIM